MSNRRSKASDIDTNAMLATIFEMNCARQGSAWVFTDEIVDLYPSMPWKVVAAKLMKLWNQDLLDGCPCGCRGDWTVTAKGVMKIVREGQGADPNYGAVIYYQRFKWDDYKDSFYIRELKKDLKNYLGSERIKWQWLEAPESAGHDPMKVLEGFQEIFAGTPDLKTLDDIVQSENSSEIELAVDIDENAPLAVAVKKAKEVMDRGDQAERGDQS